MFPLGLKISRKNSNSIRLRSLLTRPEFHAVRHLDRIAEVARTATNLDAEYDWSMKICVTKRT